MSEVTAVFMARIMLMAVSTSVAMSISTAILSLHSVRYYGCLNLPITFTFFSLSLSLSQTFPSFYQLYYIGVFLSFFVMFHLLCPLIIPSLLFLVPISPPPSHPPAFITPSPPPPPADPSSAIFCVRWPIIAIIHPLSNITTKLLVIM